MGLKLLSAFITFAIDSTAAVVVLFMMLIAMNGYSESDATPGLATFLVLSIGAGAAMGAIAFFLTGKCIAKGKRAAFAVLISAPVASVAGIILIIASSFIGIGVSEYIRVNY